MSRALRHTALLVLAGAALAGIAAALGWVVDPYALGEAHLAPALDRPLGTNLLGQDVAARLATALGRALLVGVATAAFAVAVALLLALLGAMAEPARQAVEGLAALTDAFPLYLVALVVMALVGPQVLAVIACLAAVLWVEPMRLFAVELERIRRSTASAAEIMLGMSLIDRARRSWALQLWPVIRAQWALCLALVLKAEAALGFVGAGAGELTLGGLLAEGIAAAEGGHWIELWGPVVALFALIGSALVLADVGSADGVPPTTQRRHAHGL